MHEVSVAIRAGIALDADFEWQDSLHRSFALSLVKLALHEPSSVLSRRMIGLACFGLGDPTVSALGRLFLALAETPAFWRNRAAPELLLGLAYECFDHLHIDGNIKTPTASHPDQTSASA
jgi:hypothetical protein